MLRPRVVCAVSLVLLLSGAVPALAFAAGNPPPRAPSQRGTLAEIWSSLRSLVAILGHVADPEGSLSPDLGHGVDPNGDPDLGHGIDPNG